MISLIAVDLTKISIESKFLPNITSKKWRPKLLSKLASSKEAKRLNACLATALGKPKANPPHNLYPSSTAPRALA